MAANSVYPSSCNCQFAFALGRCWFPVCHGCSLCFDVLTWLALFFLSFPFLSPVCLTLFFFLSLSLSLSLSLFLSLSLSRGHICFTKTQVELPGNQLCSSRIVYHLHWKTCATAEEVLLENAGKACSSQSLNFISFKSFVKDVEVGTYNFCWSQYLYIVEQPIVVQSLLETVFVSSLLLYSCNFCRRFVHLPFRCLQ